MEQSYDEASGFASADAVEVVARYLVSVRVGNSLTYCHAQECM